MPLTVTVNRKDYAPGVPFEIAGIGVVRNGEATELSEDQERAYVSQFYTTVLDGVGNSGDVTVSGSPLLSGTVTDILGVDPADISDTAPGLDEPAYDKSPATSMGETEADMVPVSEAPAGSTVSAGVVVPDNPVQQRVVTDHAETVEI